MILLHTEKVSKTGDEGMQQDEGRGGVPARGEPPEGGRGDAPDHFLRSGLLRLLSSQSPRLARGSLR